MDNISYEQLIENLNSLFQNYKTIELTIKNIPKVGFNGFLDLRYVKEDIIKSKNIKYNKNGVDVLLPSHVVSINFKKVENFRFLYFPPVRHMLPVSGRPPQFFVFCCFVFRVSAAMRLSPTVARPCADSEVISPRSYRH